MLVQLDPAVVKRAQHGDDDAFCDIVRAYKAPVFNYVLRSVGNRELAEDLTQEVFIRVLRSLPRYGSRAQFTTWLFQIAKNLVRDEFRTQSRRPRCVEFDEEQELWPSFSDPPIELTETMDALWAAVGELNDDMKQALLLRDIAGLSYDEIAETLEIPLSTVKWRIWNARERVQQSLTRAGVGSERAAPYALAASA